MKIDDLKQKFTEDLFLRINDQLIGVNFTTSELSITPDSSKFIKNAKYYGLYTDLDLHIITVEHSSTEDARVGVSLDIFKLMKKYSLQNALVAAYSKSSDSWRHSLVTSTLAINGKGKVTKEFSNPRRYSFVLGPDQKILTPYKQLIQSGSVNTLEELSKRFSIEVVNDEFYKEIARLYDELLGIDKLARKLKYPPDNDESHEFAVRLIGRIIFCWFLREKKSKAGISLVPNSILSREASNQPNYYHSILAPLFFEVLNKPIPKRADKFKTGIYAKIPYLNGGLFNPDNIDHYSFDKGLETSNPALVDIESSWLHELLDLLERFNFTVDENTTYDTDLSIDPEMLGRVFENLLARINPETGETVRKSTGSFYTPREIVEYMVDAGLSEYLISQTGLSKDKTEALVSYDLFDDLENVLNAEERILALEALSTLTVLDPACGSGAFPIGMLQKIVFIITKLDPKAEWWLAKQLEGASPEIRREFANRSVDYIRKLGIIRQTIFGVDIQPIATEISRLRCFLTLIVDEAIDDIQEDRGVRPLPNLDFKFVTANSLVKIPQKISTGSIQGDMFEDSNNIEKLRKLREDFFSSNPSERNELKLQFLQTQKDLFEGMIKSGAHGQQSLALSSWDPFSHKSTEWFDPEWMFGIKEGFGIVIGNPPYVKKEHLIQKQIDELEYNFSEVVLDSKMRSKQRSWSDDLYVHFIFKAFELAAPGGVVTYITNDSFMGFSSKLRVRNLLLVKDLKALVACPAETFDATIYTAVFVATNTKLVGSSYKGARFSYPAFELLDESIVEKKYVRTLPSDRLVLEENPIVAGLLGLPRSKEYLSIIDTGIHTGNVRNKILSKTKLGESWEKLLQGKQILRWAINWQSKSAKYLYCNPSYVPLPIPGVGRGGKPSKANEYWHFCGDSSNHLKAERLLIRQTEDDVYVAYQNNKEDGQFYTDNTLFTVLPKDGTNLKYALGVMNSRLINYYYKYLSQEDGKSLAQIKIGLLDELPFCYKPELEEKLVRLVDDAIEAKRKSPDAKIDAIEDSINKIVYEIYEVTPEEISLIEDQKT